MNIKIRYLPVVRQYFSELIRILYKDGYFDFVENAIAYVDELEADILRYLPSFALRNTPQQLREHGDFYAVFNKGKRTSWYVFFNIYEQNGELIYLIRFVSNNHVAGQHMNSPE